MEIERKFLITKVPDNLLTFEKREIVQGYLCTEPVVRVRQWNTDYILTYKSKGFQTRVEEEMPLTKEAFDHLLAKADGTIINKTRYLIPDRDGIHTIELDQFHDQLEGIYLAEVEFTSEEDAKNYVIPDWFSKEMTFDGRFHNSQISRMNQDEVTKLVSEFHI